jgi:hypothetical protein
LTSKSPFSPSWIESLPDPTSKELPRIL